MTSPNRILSTSLRVALAAAALLACASGCGREGNELGRAEASTVPVAAATTSPDEVRVVPATPEPVAQAPRPAEDPAQARARARAATLEALRGPLLRASAVAAVGADWRLSNNGLPRNVRQTPEGYWVGAEPDAGHLAELHARGVRVVLSGTRLSSAARELADELDMRHIDVPFGGRFPDHQALVDGTSSHDAREIYIHCEHGGDRSGAMLAFLLTTREQWPASRALIAVAYPNGGDIRRLIALMRDEGVDVDDDEAERYAGIYSPELNGGFGGLKVRGDSYRKLVVTTLSAMRDAGVL